MGGPPGGLGRGWALAHSVERTIRRHAMLAGGETVLVAVSGGADSVALLHFLRRARPGVAALPSTPCTSTTSSAPTPLATPSSSGRSAARLGVPADVVTRDRRYARLARGGGAGIARYAALEAAPTASAPTGSRVGHTADDQAETVLMRLLRGRGGARAGRDPARARPDHSPPHRGAPGRARGRAAARRAIPWVEDPTNRDPKFLRNRIRHELLPLLADSYNPGSRRGARPGVHAGARHGRRRSIEPPPSSSSASPCSTPAR